MNFGGLGDQILFLPSLYELKKSFKNDEIFLITEPRAEKISRLTNLLDEQNIITFDYKNGNKLAKAFELIQIIKSGKYDFVFSTGSSFWVRILLWLTGVKDRFYIQKRAQKQLKDNYAAELLFSCVKGYTEAEFAAPRIDLKEDAKFANYQIVDSENSYLAIHPGVSQLSTQKGHAKAWNAKSWIKLIKKLKDKFPNLNLILCGGPEDLEINKAILKKCADDLINFSEGTSDIADLAHLFSKIDAVLCMDSAPMHLAYSVGTTTIALFSTTDHKRLLPQDIDYAHPLYSSKIKDGQHEWEIKEIIKLINDKVVNYKG